MEESERNLIRSKLTTLVVHTNCSREFLMYFYSKKILSLDDLEQIAAKIEGSSRATEFYKIIKTRTNAFQVLTEALELFHQFGALNALKGENVEPLSLAEVDVRVAKLLREQPSKANIKFDVSPPVSIFTGRKKELEELHRMVLRSEKTVTVISQLTTVTGLGGIGKTQLARHYVQEKSSEFDGNVLWLNAESENTLAESFRRLALEKLCLSTKDGNGNEKSLKGVAEDVYKHFEGYKALFVFDNADKTPWLIGFLAAHSKFYSLVTSRTREWGRGVKILGLGVLLTEEAMEMVKKGLEIEGESQDDEVKILVTTYIYNAQQQSTYSIRGYLEEFRAKQAELLSFKEEDSIEETYLFTTATTWHITVEKIASDPNHGLTAIQILNASAYLSPDDLSRSLFFRLQKIFNEVLTEADVKAAVRLLVKYSMLEGRDRQSILGVHRLVQAVTRNQLVSEEREEKTLELVLQLVINDNKEENGGLNNLPKENTANALAAWSHVWGYKSLINSNPHQVIQIIMNMLYLGRHEEAIKFGNEALFNFKKVFGVEALHCFRIQRRISMILTTQGRFKESLGILTEMQDKVKVLFGEESEIYLEIRAEMGGNLRRMGRYEEAIKIQQETIAKKKTVFGENSATLMLSNYGMTLMESGRLEEALEIFEKLKKEGVLNLKIQNYLGNIHLQRGDFEEALVIYQELFKEVSPMEDMTFYATVCSNLGITLNSVGMGTEALEVLEQALEKVRDRLGAQHYRTIEMMKFIGNVKLSLGYLTEALNIYQSVYKGFVEISGENSLEAENVAEVINDIVNYLEEYPKELNSEEVQDSGKCCKNKVRCTCIIL